MLTAASRVFELQSIHDTRGDLAIVEDLPFKIVEVAWTAEPHRSGVVEAERDALLVALTGNFDVLVGDGAEPTRITLDHPSQGLLVAAAYPRRVDAIARGSLCLLVGGRRS